MIARLRALVSRRALAAFFVLAFALSWWPSLITPHSIVPLGPLVAALAIAALIGGRAEVVTFLRRIVQWRAHAGWYGLVLLLPFATTAGAVALNRIWSALPPALERAPPLAELAPGRDPARALAAALRREHGLSARVGAELAACERALTHRALTLRAFACEIEALPRGRGLRFAGGKSREAMGLPSAVRELLGRL